MATEDQILQEVARRGTRKALLWQLAADGRSFMGVEFAGQHLDEDNPTVEAMVDEFVDTLTTEDGTEIKASHGEGVDWEALEERYGDEADEIVAAIK
jgi:hypothetical protein